MKRLKHIAAALICGALVGVCGCSQQAGNGSAVSTVQFSDESAKTNSAFEAPTESGNTESPDLTYLGAKEIEGSTAFSMYKQSTNGSVNVTYVSGSAYEDRLAELISADNSPDLTDKRENTYPYLISKNSYEDLTAYMDTAAPQWTDYTGYIEHYSFKGAHYFYPSSVKLSPEVLVYDKTKFVLFNIPDPEKLLEKGEWTWENFRCCAETFTAMEGSGCYAYGMNIADNLLATTGVSTVWTDPTGKPVFGMSMANFSEVLNFFAEGCFNQQTTDTSLLRSSLAAFMSADEEIIGELRKTDFTLGIVPYPRWDAKNAYFCKTVTDGYLVPKGAKNITNAASFINCSRLADTSDEKTRAVKLALRKQGLLLSDIEWLNTIRSLEEVTPVISDVYCLDSESNGIIHNNFIAADGLCFGEDNSLPVDSILHELEKIGALMDN